MAKSTAAIPDQTPTGLSGTAGVRAGGSVLSSGLEIGEDRSGPRGMIGQGGPGDRGPRGKGGDSMFRPSSQSGAFAVAALAFAALQASAPPALGQQGVLDTRDPSGVLRTITLDGSRLGPLQPVLPEPGHQRPVLRLVPRRRRPAGRSRRAEVQHRFDVTARPGPDLPDRRRLELAERRMSPRSTPGGRPTACCSTRA